ncbi:polysaccharide biosynthesis tyrosine autokinase [Fontisphaera persica]|uniref:polysaccharide biosynthesis tyrosine autokinase n=1 Tax=Fontisphaera persica TaxID=2974023 RepID=UPI0024BF7355|nr:polysaccharide biosynthesis tyrosine autokinase [Fontisphaera persica]WCJ60877.1 polysaccharide biosynthesis tyrosine autokinase [Fontisphaera persica]
MLPGLKRRGINFADIVLYVAIALKHWRLMVLLVFFALSLGLTFFVYVKPVYMAKSLIRYHALERPVDAEKVFRDSSERELINRLTADHIIRRTARRLGLPDNPKILYAEYLRAVQVRFNSERNLEVTVLAYQGDVVRKWTETMLEEFLKDREEKRVEMREKIISSYTEELKEVSRRMEEALMSTHEVESGRKTELQTKLALLQEVPKQLVEVSERLEVLERVRKTLNDESMDVVSRLSLLSSILKNSTIRPGDLVPGGEGANKSPVVVVPASVTSPSQMRWEDLQREHEKLQLAINELGKKYLPGHPKMAEVLKKMEEVNRGLEAELRAAQQTYHLEYLSLTQKKAELQARLPDYEKALLEQKMFMQELERKGAGNLSFAAMYKEMATRLSMIDFGADKERSHLQFMGHIELRDEIPVSPNRLKLVVYSLGLGIFLALGIPFLIEFLDHTVSNVEEMEQNHRLRGLGIVPRLEPSQLPGSPVAGGHMDRQIVENFRVIRTNLLSMGAVTRDPQVVVIASAMPEEGKTVVSYNLARSFAQMGEKTLLIDADLRRGRLHRLFGQRSAPGLSNILMQHADWRDVVRPTDHEHLTLLACGKHLEGATELVGSPTFEKLLTELRQEYRRIIIDTPPVLGLSETAMLQRLVDGVVLVVWCGRTPARYVKSAVEILQANHANFYGFVLNRLDLSVTSNYYNYYNYYYYSYHYYKSYKTVEAQPAAESNTTPAEKSTS